MSFSYQNPTEESTKNPQEHSEFVNDKNYGRGTLTDPSKYTDQLEHLIGYSKISVTSEVLYKLITQESSGVPVKPVLLTVAGLPECGKSKVLNEVLKEKVKVKHDAMAHYTPQKREISYCELSATVHPFGQDSYPTYIETSKSTTYVYAIESALKSQFLWQSKLIYGYHVPICNENFFGDEELNSHFLYIMRELEKSHQRKNVTDWDESVTDNWHKQIPNGVTLINIWDVNASKAVFHFLPSLWGKLGRCHTWLFCNVDRDFEHFHEKPYLSKGQKDDQHLMPYHNRLYYLLQQSLLSKSKAYHKNRVCSVFGFQNQSETDTSNISELISNEAGRMGVNNIVDENVTILNHKSYEILKKKLDEIVYTTQESRETIPLKYIFLRSLFYTLTKIFVSKDVLKSKAKKVKMSEEDVQRFCEIFTSSGSLFDLDPNLPFVIMKPIGFVRKLEKLFYPESKLEDDKLLEYGLLTAERAKEIFGEEYECFLQVLITQNLIVDLSSVSVYSDTCEVPIHDAYYMPSVRSVPPDLKSDPQSLHLLLDIDCSLCHMQVLFAKRYLHANKQCALILEKGLPVNITKFKLGQSDFQLQYLGDVIEFRISDSGTDGLASIIIDMCNKVMQQDGPSIKYNFAVMCLKCHSREDADCLNRPHHILPCDQCIHCNGSHSVMNLFNGILKHDPVPDERKLTYELMVTDITYVGEKLSTLTNDGQKAVEKMLKEDVRSKLDKLPPKIVPLVQKELQRFQRECDSHDRQPLLNLINWEEDLKTLGSKHDCSKTSLANLLINLSKEVSEVNDRRKLMAIAQTLDPRVFEQRRVELMTT